jgi:hypothetical protein
LRWAQILAENSASEKDIMIAPKTYELETDD